MYPILEPGSIFPGLMQRSVSVMTDRFNVGERSLGRELENSVSNCSSRSSTHGGKSWGLSLSSVFLSTCYIWLLDLSSKNIENLIQFEFQINNGVVFSISMSQTFPVTYLYNIYSNIFIYSKYIMNIF